MRPYGSLPVIEGRRKCAIALLKAGLPIREIARRLKCSPSSVLRWRNAWRAKGLKALEAKRPKGRPPKMGEEEREKLASILQKGAKEFGFEDDAWTSRRVAKLIYHVFGIKYHPDHITRLLHSLDFRYIPPGQIKNGSLESKNGRWGWVYRKSMQAPSSEDEGPGPQTHVPQGEYDSQSSESDVGSSPQSG